MSNQSMRRHRSLAILTAFTVGVLATAGNRMANAVEAQWNFEDATLTPYHNDHTTVMSFPTVESEPPTVAFGTASSFGLPAMPGGDATLMSFPAFAPFQALALNDLGPANGGGSYINQYTMAFDILVPNVSANWFSFYQTNSLNSEGNDGDFFIRPEDGGIGISGNYVGLVTSGEWHRIVVAVDLTTSTMDKYINGTLVGTQTLGSGVDGRWSIYTDVDDFVPPESNLFILTDDSDETNAGYISSFYWTDRYVDATTIASWGGADADGVYSPSGPVPMPDLNMDGKVDIFDVAIVSNNWANSGTPGTVTGDANKDGVVDIFDVALISNNWNPGGASAVPEPGSLCLALLGTAAAIAIVRRRRG